MSQARRSRRSRRSVIANAVGALIHSALCLAFGVGLLIVPWVLRDSELERRDDWLPAKGKVVRVERFFIYQAATTNSIHVTFSDNQKPGRTHAAAVYDDSKPPVGSEIDLTYNPVDPTEVRKGDECITGCGPYFPFFVVLTALAAGMCFWAGVGTLRDLRAGTFL